MKKFIIILMSLSLILLLSTIAFTGSYKTRQITGNVIAIDTKSNTVTVRKKDKEVLISVGEKTSIRECAPRYSITDLKVGNKITAKYKDGGNNPARSITIRESSWQVE